MEHIEERGREAVEEVPGVGVLLVFGSRGRGEARVDSDLDVAVLPRPDAGEEDGSRFRHRLQKRLAVALAALAPEGRVASSFSTRRRTLCASG